MAIRKHLICKISWSSSHFRAVISDSLKTKQMSLFGSMLFMGFKVFTYSCCIELLQLPRRLWTCKQHGTKATTSVRTSELLQVWDECSQWLLLYHVNCFATDQGPRVRKRRIILSRSSPKLVGLLSGWIWKIEMLSPLKKKLYPAVNFPFSVKCRRAYMSIRFLLIWTQSQNKFRYSQPFCGLSKTYQVFNFEGQNLPGKCNYPFYFNLNTLILGVKQTVGPRFRKPKLLNWNFCIWWFLLDRCLWQPAAWPVTHIRCMVLEEFK